MYHEIEYSRPFDVFYGYNKTFELIQMYTKPHMMFALSFFQNYIYNICLLTTRGYNMFYI